MRLDIRSPPAPVNEQKTSLYKHLMKRIVLIAKLAQAHGKLLEHPQNT